MHEIRFGTNTSKVTDVQNVASQEMDSQVDRSL